MNNRRRLDRAVFHAQTGALDADALRRILWHLYLRSPAPVRERIEDALAPAPAAPKRRSDGIHGELLRDDAMRFVALARSGAYLGGTREVSRQERAGWRLTCKRLVNEATALLQDGDLEYGAPALEALIDLLCETRDFEYFRSEDPVAAARIVVSETVETLWRAWLEQRGFSMFARQAAEQLIRWESPYGWTRLASGAVAKRETSLTDKVSNLLRGQDAWDTFADAYLAALDRLAPAEEPLTVRGAKRKPAGMGDDWMRRRALDRRAGNLRAWHGRLLEWIEVNEPARRLDRIASHPALGGPEMDFMKARIARLRGNDARARTLIERCLKALPGHSGFIAFAREIGATLPSRSAEIVREQER